MKEGILSAILLVGAAAALWAGGWPFWTAVPLAIIIVLASAAVARRLVP